MTAPRHRTMGDALVFLAPIYLGPLLAGLAQMPRAVPMVLAALGLAMVFAVKPPEPFPGAGFAIRLFALILHAALTALAYGAGWLVAEAVAPLPLPLWLPILTSVVALAVARRLLARAPAPTPEPAASTPTSPPPTPSEGDGVQSALLALWDAPPDPASVDPVLAKMRGAASDDQMIRGLVAMMDEGSDAIDLAAMRFLSDPAARRAALAADRLRMALTLGLTSSAAPVRAEASLIAYALISETAPAAAFPEAARLGVIARTYPDTAEALAAIAAHLPKGEAE